MQNDENANQGVEGVGTEESNRKAESLKESKDVAGQGKPDDLCTDNGHAGSGNKKLIGGVSVGEPLKSDVNHEDEFNRSAKQNSSRKEHNGSAEKMSSELDSLLKPPGDKLKKSKLDIVVENWVDCDECHKWRLLPNNYKRPRNTRWLCSMQTWLETGKNHCRTSEEETTSVVTEINRNIKSSGHNPVKSHGKSVSKVKKLGT